MQRKAPRQRTILQGTFPFEGIARINERRPLGRVGIGILQEYIEQKTPEQISRERGIPLQVVIGTIQRALGKSPEPNEVFKKRIIGATEERIPAHPTFVFMGRVKSRTINPRAILDEITQGPLSSARMKAAEAARKKAERRAQNLFFGEVNEKLLVELP